MRSSRKTKNAKKRDAKKFLAVFGAVVFASETTKATKARANSLLRSVRAGALRVRDRLLDGRGLARENARLRRENARLRAEAEAARKLGEAVERDFKRREEEWRERVSSSAPSVRSESDYLQENVARLRSEAIASSPVQVRPTRQQHLSLCQFLSLSYSSDRPLSQSPRKSAFERPRSKKNAPPGSTSPLRDKLVKIEDGVGTPPSPQSPRRPGEPGW